MSSAHPAATAAAHRRVSLRPRVFAHRTARRLVRDLCSESGLPATLVDDATLVTGELVRSSVRSARMPVDVSVEVVDRTVTVRVHDQETTCPTRRNAWRGAGRSREIVARFSTSWGYHQCSGGRELWASFRTPRPQVQVAVA